LTFFLLINLHIAILCFVDTGTFDFLAICKFIRRKKVNKAIHQLEEVIEMRRAIPMKGELPHRKGMERGRYPIKAVKEFIKLLRQLSANAVVNGLDIDKAKIECKADKAARPYRRFGRTRFKRTNILLKLKINKIKQAGK
jgi:ribosomal protein L22